MERRPRPISAGAWRTSWLPSSWRALPAATTRGRVIETLLKPILAACVSVAAVSGTTGSGEAAVFESLPAWSSGPVVETQSVALGDVDGDGDLDLACGNYLQSNTLYLNQGGTFATTPAW